MKNPNLFITCAHTDYLNIELKRIDGWTDDRANRWASGWTGKCTHGRTNRRTDGKNVNKYIIKL